MNPLRLSILVLLIIGSTISSQAQRYNIGIRAGLNYSDILGPNEADLMVNRSLNNGIHFGLTYSYKFTDIFGLKTELAYSSVGTKVKMEGQGYYIFGNSLSTPFAKEGYTTRTLEVTNSYINLPFHAYIKPFEKLELFGGFYVSFLINPTAGGSLRFDDQSDETQFGFIQALDYNYYTDDPLQGKSAQAIVVIIDEVVYNLPQTAGAYYQFRDKDRGLYRWFDAGLSAGFQYYINRSFFAGFRADYGLIDITRSGVDVSLSKLDGNVFIQRQDYDQNFSMQISLGFKF